MMRIEGLCLVVLSAVGVFGQSTTSSSSGGLSLLPSGVPSCALSCATLFLSSTSQCPNASSDPSCLCKSSSFQSSAASCIVKSCTSTTDQQSAYSYASGLCASAGVTLPSLSQLTSQASASGTAGTKATTTGVPVNSGAERVAVVGVVGVVVCALLGVVWV